MKKVKLSEMTRGWFIGNFSPTLLSTQEIEVGVKNYVAGDKEPCHVHKVATEITVVVSGKISMNGCEYGCGDIIILEPGEKTDFLAITDTTTTVVK